MSRAIAVIVLSMSFSHYCAAQQTNSHVPKERTVYHALQIGDTVPRIPFRNTVNFPKKNMNLYDFKGKLILLDFWATWCPSCIRLMPKLEAMETQFEGKFQVVLINSDEEEKTIYERLKLRNISVQTGHFLSTLPASNGDMVWQTLFPHNGVPHEVWIDQTGRIIAITGGENATAENVQKLLNGEKLNFAEKKDLIGYDIAKDPFIKPAHDFLPPLNYYSVFMNYYAGIGGGFQQKDDSLNHLCRYQYRNANIFQLYHGAYPELGTHVVAETSDLQINAMRPGLYSLPDDDWKRRNLYCYELLIPLSEKKHYTKFMREDLNRFFGINRHIEGVVENRIMTTFVLINLREDRPYDPSDTKINGIVSQTDSSYLNRGFALHALVSNLEDILDDLRNNIAFADETGINPDTKVDFEIPKDRKNVNLLIACLRKNGFDLVKAQRKITLLVIKDTVTN